MSLADALLLCAAIVAGVEAALHKSLLAVAVGLIAVGLLVR